MSEDTDTYCNVLICNAWLTSLHNDHRAANPPAITGNEHGTMVVIDVHAHELANSSRSPQFAERGNEVGGIAGEPYDGAIYVYDVGMWCVYLGTRGETNICDNAIAYIRKSLEALTLYTKQEDDANNWLLFHVSCDVRH